MTNDLSKIRHAKNMERRRFSIGALPTSYMTSLSYEEQLIDLYHYIARELVPVINENADASEELQNNVNSEITNLTNNFNNLQDTLQTQINADITNAVNTLTKQNQKCGIYLKANNDAQNPVNFAVNNLNSNNDIKFLIIPYQFKTVMTENDFNEILNKINSKITIQNEIKYINIDNVLYKLSAFTHLIIDMPFSSDETNNDLAMTWFTLLINKLNNFNNMVPYFIPYCNEIFSNLTFNLARSINNNICNLYYKSQNQSNISYLLTDIWIASEINENWRSELTCQNCVKKFITNNETNTLSLIGYSTQAKINETNLMGTIFINLKNGKIELDLQDFSVGYPVLMYNFNNEEKTLYGLLKSQTFRLNVPLYILENNFLNNSNLPETNGTDSQFILLSNQVFIKAPNIITQFTIQYSYGSFSIIFKQIGTDTLSSNYNISERSFKNFANTDKIIKISATGNIINN